MYSSLFYVLISLDIMLFCFALYFSYVAFVRRWCGSYEGMLAGWVVVIILLARIYLTGGP